MITNETHLRSRMKQMSKIIPERVKFKSVALTTRPKCLEELNATIYVIIGLKKSYEFVGLLDVTGD